MGAPTTKPVHPDNNDAMLTDYDENEAPGGEDIYGAGGDADTVLPPENVNGMEDLSGGTPAPGERASPAEGGD